MAIVSSEVVKEYMNFNLLPGPQIAVFMRSTSEAAGDMVMVSHLVEHITVVNLKGPFAN